MSHHLVPFAHRPGLVALFLLYAVTAAFVARSALTVAVCTVLLANVAVQVVFVVRRARAHPAGVR